MTRLLTLTIYLGALIACAEETEFYNKGLDTKRLKAKDAVAEVSEPDEGSSEIAAEPVAIGGAYLTCRLPAKPYFEEEQVLLTCFIRNTENQLIDLPAGDINFSASTGDQQAQVTAKKIGAGEYILSVIASRDPLTINANLNDEKIANLLIRFTIVEANDALGLPTQGPAAEELVFDGQPPSEEIAQPDPDIPEPITNLQLAQQQQPQEQQLQAQTTVTRVPISEKIPRNDSSGILVGNGVAVALARALNPDCKYSTGLFDNARPQNTVDTGFEVEEEVQLVIKLTGMCGISRITSSPNRLELYKDGSLFKRVNIPKSTFFKFTKSVKMQVDATPGAYKIVLKPGKIPLGFSAQGKVDDFYVKAITITEK